MLASLVATKLNFSVGDHHRTFFGNAQTGLDTNLLLKPASHPLSNYLGYFPSYIVL